MASYSFYATIYLPHLAVLIWISLISYFGARYLNKFRSKKNLFLFIFLVLTPLFVFKYFNFTKEFVKYFEGIEPFSLNLLIPVGISFYVFQSISYLVDIYRKRIKTVMSIGEVALYLSFFPQLLAGPIERSSKLCPQFQNLLEINSKNLHFGTKFILWGLFCKMAVSDNLAGIIDPILTNNHNHSAISLIAVLYLYSFQIYFDFLGYTNLAIGIARLFGIKLSNNFNRPYLAPSLQEFWRRWHITLSTWFRDYLYIPLGGKSNSVSKHMINLFIVFILSGLWHGASLNFLCWGFFHGCAYIIENIFRKMNLISFSYLRFPKIFITLAKITLTFSVITLSWSFFLINDLSTIFSVFQKVFHYKVDINYFSIADSFFNFTTVAIIILLLITFFMDSTKWLCQSYFITPKKNRELFVEICLVNFFLVAIILFRGDDTFDFIYYRF